jgi:hypothetical protein
VGIVEDVERVAKAALGLAARGETVAGIVPAEPAAGARTYLCAYTNVNGERSWIVLDADGVPISDRSQVRDVVSIAALCELAEDVAFSGDLDALRTRLDELDATDAPSGIDDACEAAKTLAAVRGEPPQVASAGRLDALGAAARRLEAALYDPAGGSPFSAAMRGSSTVLTELLAEVESTYRVPLEA